MYIPLLAIQNITKAARLAPKISLLNKEFEKIRPPKISRFFTHWYGRRRDKYNDKLKEFLSIIYK
jgi:hypothetical protein